MVNNPNTIKKIGDRAFANSSLTEITLPSSITSISDSAFDGCKKVEYLNSCFKKYQKNKQSKKY